MRRGRSRRSRSRRRTQRGSHGRLATASGPWESGSSSTWTHGYDPLGNLRSLSSSSGYTRAWTYGDTVRPRVLTAFSESGGINDSSITTSASGNLLQRQRGGSTQTFTWNAQNRLYTISNYNPIESSSFEGMVMAA